MNEVCHAGEWEVDCTEAWKNRHHSDANDSDSRHPLLDSEDSSINA